MRDQSINITKRKSGSVQQNINSIKKWQKVSARSLKNTTKPKKVF